VYVDYDVFYSRLTCCFTYYYVIMHYYILLNCNSYVYFYTIWARVSLFGPACPVRFLSNKKYFYTAFINGIHQGIPVYTN